MVTGQPLEISLRDGHLGIITFTNLKRAFLSFESRCATWAFVKRANGNDRSCGGHLPPSVYSASTRGAGGSLESSTCPSVH